MAAVPVRIRDFEPEDFDRLWQIDQECFAPGISYSRQELKTYMRRRGSFTLVAEKLAVEKLVVEKEDRRPDLPNAAKHAEADTHSRIQGFIVAYGGRTGHIITIDVIAPARRTGLGSRLLAAAEDRLRTSRSQAVGLETAVDNAAAIAFYKRHGYSVAGTWPRYYSNGVDALVMRKQLQAQN